MTCAIKIFQSVREFSCLIKSAIADYRAHQLNIKQIFILNIIAAFLSHSLWIQHFYHRYDRWITVLCKFGMRLFASETYYLRVRLI